MTEHGAWHLERPQITLAQTSADDGFACLGAPCCALQCIQCRQHGNESVFIISFAEHYSYCCSHGLKEEHARFFFQQIILAIDYCHKMKVSNR